MYYLYFPKPLFYATDYGNYLNKLILDTLKINHFNVNIYVKDHMGNIDNNTIKNNNNKNIFISVNYEHTLVKQEGRNATKCADIARNSPIGNILDKNGNKYLVRINKIDSLKDSHIIIDYSHTNIVNVKSIELYKDLSKKHICISPAFFENYHIKENRNINILTTFIDLRECIPLHKKNRIHFYNQLKSSKIKDLYKNINNCFGLEKLERLYKNTKILINIRQSIYHHTIEEIRILPAIQLGVIVISQDAPLKEAIPYHDYIIWEPLENIIEKAYEVYQNYDKYFNLIYGSKNKKNLNEIHKDNINILTNKIKMVI
jgi:hypothetical protein